MEQRTFEGFRKLIYRECGIVLTTEKLSLLSSRINKRILKLGLPNEQRYLEIIESDASGTELIQLINSISTNTTYFYREPSHFETFRTIVRQRIQAGFNETKVWCAASSSGEEPYTLAFEAAEAVGKQPMSVKILATDISTKVLNMAVAASYPESALEHIPAAIRTRYTQPVPTDDSGKVWTVTPDIRRMLLFKKLNLVEIPYPLKGPVDIIFCRNVMIYFDAQTRGKIVREFQRLLSPNGHLFLSHSENLLGVDHGLKKCGASIFQKPGGVQ